MKVLLLGAGASKCYEDSSTGIKMPIAKDFFPTFRELDVSENHWVLFDAILSYLHEYHQFDWKDFLKYDEDIEVLHSEIEQKLRVLLSKKENILGTYEGLIVFRAYIQIISLFTCVINAIQNGIASTNHLELAKRLSSEDCIITFNWDTLMDRALKETTSWNCESGYYVKPSRVYRDGWDIGTNDTCNNFPTFLKLHGSTNWITSIIRPDVDKLKSIQETPVDDFYVFESCLQPYPTYKGRFMPGYADFSYGYYPPNLPLKGESPRKGYSFVSASFSIEGMNDEGIAPQDGLLSMPLIIPPVQEKNYSHFGNLFNSLWDKAQESLTKAESIIIIGYSFPITDVKTEQLFKYAFNQRQDMPLIKIVDPYPERIVNKFKYDFGISEANIKVYETFFDKNFDFDCLF